MALSDTVTEVRTQALELATWLNSFGVTLRNLQDPSAARAIQMAAGASKVANNLADALQAMGDAVDSTVTAAVAAVTPHSGTIIQAFGGAANEFHNVTPIAAPWVTATSAIFVAYNGAIPYPPPTFDFEMFRGNARNRIAGTSFDLLLNNPGAPPAANYSFFWWSFG